jgi:hypothetical protein
MFHVSLECAIYGYFKGVCSAAVIKTESFLTYTCFALLLSISAVKQSLPTKWQFLKVGIRDSRG